MIPSPADLRYFMEIAQTQNVSRASERLGISQPSLSLAIRRMEQQLGVALFIRSKRGVSLTQAGRQLLTKARHLLQTWEEVRAGAIASMEEVQGSYILGCHASVAMHSLHGIIPALMAAHPRLNLTLKHDISRKITEDVISMKVDIGIVVNPVQHPDLVILPVCKDEFTLWRSAEGIATTDVLICDPDLAQSQTLTKKLSREGIKIERFMTSGNLEVIADLTAHGAGYGLLPAQVAVRARKKLVRVPKAPVFYDDHCLVFRVENRNVKSIQVLHKAIKNFFG
jgi:DNA-binding transcriptional LysR family regulator